MLVEKGHIIKLFCLLLVRLPLGPIEDQCSVQLLGHVCANFHSIVRVY